MQLPAPAAPDHQPRGVRGYTFSETETKRTVGLPVALEQSYQRERKQWSDTIEMEYTTLVNLRADIDAMLAGFRQRLDLSEDAKLSVCFGAVRELVGPYQILNLNEQEMKIMISDEANPNAVEAVNKFNTMLEKCREFQGNVCTSKPVMEENLRALEKEKKLTQAVLDVIERAKKQLCLVREWNEHVKCIISDTKTSSKNLAPKKATGLRCRAELES